MNKQIPSFGKIFVMVAFAGLCFVLLLWLWLTFGGSAPLKANGYRFTVPFGEATQLAKEADVRISGVNVGKVKGLETDKRSGLSIATIEMKPGFAPVPVDTKATLRQKTLLGETYIQLTPGTSGARAIAEGGALAKAQVSPTVELDEILRTFDPKTRKELSNWIEQQAIAFTGRSADVSELIGNLPGFEEELTKTLTVLDQQSAALKEFSGSTADVLAALTEQQGQLTSLISNSERVFSTTGRRNTELAEAIKALPTFQRELTATTKRLTKYAENTDPLVKELTPAARAATPVVQSVAKSAPNLAALARGVGPLVDASEKGLPATTEFLQQFRAFTSELDAPLSQLAPVLDEANLYRQEITSAIANASAALELEQRVNDDPKTKAHVLRVTTPLNPEGLSLYSNRLPTNRQNAYALPGAGKALGTKPVYDARSCGPDLTITAEGSEANIDPTLLQQIIKYALNGGDVRAPTCSQQPRFDLGGTITRFLQVRADPAGLRAGLPVP